MRRPEIEMSELAFNINGEPFEPDERADAYRVRRMRLKGPSELVYGPDGKPAALPIDADLDDLRRLVDQSGRYRLDQIDALGKAIPDAPSAYIQVNLEPSLPERRESTSTAASATASEHVLVEAMRLQSMIAQSVVERFPQMMDAAANLLRAADGAGLPARQPVPVESEAEVVDMTPPPPAAPSGFDLNAIVAQVVSTLVTGAMSGNVKVPGLGALLDWRKAAKPTPEPKPAQPPRIERTGEREPAPKTTTVEAAEAPATTALPPLSPANLAHFAAVQAALSPDERRLAAEVAKDLGPDELRAWFDELSTLSVTDAAAKIRTIVAALGKEGAS
jgi:hypothetical protein